MHFEIHLNHGIVRWEVLEVNSTYMDSCLNPSRHTEAQLGASNWGMDLKGMEAGTFGSRSLQTTTHSDWAHSSTLLDEGHQLARRREAGGSKAH